MENGYATFETFENIYALSISRLTAFCLCLLSLSGWVAVSLSHFFCPRRFANFETKDAQPLFTLGSKLFSKDGYDGHFIFSPLPSLCPSKKVMGNWDNKGKIILHLHLITTPNMYRYQVVLESLCSFCCPGHVQVTQVNIVPIQRCISQKANAESKFLKAVL